MLKGIYSAAAGITSQMLMTDILADNLANASTPGHKVSNGSFKAFNESFIQRLQKDKGNEQVGSYAQGSILHETVIDFSQGELIQTGNTYDLGLQGDGFFVVKTSDKQELAYTRAGNFTVDQDGTLMTLNGDHVQGQGGDIQIPREAKRIEVSEKGDIHVDGQVLDRIRVVEFENTKSLQRLGANLFSATEEPLPIADSTRVVQGMVERSNANVITELINSLTGLRIYESLQRSIQMQSETLNKAVNEVGK